MGVTGWWAEVHTAIAISAPAALVVRAHAPSLSIDNAIMMPGPASLVIHAHLPVAECVIPGYPSEFLYPSEDLYPVGV